VRRVGREEEREADRMERSDWKRGLRGLKWNGLRKE
jgi:hypothetical protein